MLRSHAKKKNQKKITAGHRMSLCACPAHRRRRHLEWSAVTPASPAVRPVHAVFPTAVAWLRARAREVVQGNGAKKKKKKIAHMPKGLHRMGMEKRVEDHSSKRYGASQEANHHQRRARKKKKGNIGQPLQKNSCRASAPVMNRSSTELTRRTGITSEESLSESCGGSAIPPRPTRGASLLLLI